MGSDCAGLLEPNDCSLYRQISRKLATRRLSEMLRWVVILLIFLYIFKIYMEYSPGYVIDKNFADVVPGPSSANLLANVCSNETKRCYGVMDYAEDERGLIVRRVIYVKGFEKEVDTMVRLKPPPEGLSFHNSDSKLWEVNHRDLNTQYIAVLCLFPFVLGSVPSLENKVDTASILNIGLGGGSIDMFLHELKPTWKIDVYELDPIVKKLAHEWFGVVDDAYRKTYASKYDVIIIDGCDTDQTIPCPAKDFLKPQTLKNMREAIKPTGCVLFNVLVLKEGHIDEHVAMIEHRLLLHFPTCLAVRMNTEDNVILACLPYSLEPSAAQKTKEVWRQDLDDMLNKFAFNFSD
ncbi:hypothetical protein M3Y97_00202100 [Aphelenchoides bicaudatus]|nr:hypothetical protein M3Y97_00202100 [Aphelenchoides bicaudatus]